MKKIQKKDSERNNDGGVSKAVQWFCAMMGGKVNFHQAKMRKKKHMRNKNDWMRTLFLPQNLNNDFVWRSKERITYIGKDGEED